MKAPRVYASLKVYIYLFQVRLMGRGLFVSARYTIPALLRGKFRVKLRACGLYGRFFVGHQDGWIQYIDHFPAGACIFETVN